MAPTAVSYASYADVPYYRRQWFFWLMWFVFSPIAIGILLSGDVYYRRKGQVRNFGLANRVVAGLTAPLWLLALLSGMPSILALVTYSGAGLLVLFVARMAWTNRAG